MDIQGHVFTVQLQGLTAFKLVQPIERYLPPSAKRTLLNFPLGDNEPAAIKIVGRWYSQAVLMNNMQSGILGPQMTAMNPQGKEYSAFLCSSPEGEAGDGRIMVITCEAIPKLDQNEETTLTFIGGFDASTIVNNLSKTTSFLALSYPAEDADALAERIGSIDLRASPRKKRRKG